MNLLSVLAKVSGITLISRVTGLIRDTLIARAFGVSDMTDAFQVAFRIPNLLRRLFAEGAFSQAFVPILAETRARGDEQETRSLIDHTAGALGVILLVVSVLGVLASPFIVRLTAPGFAANGAKFHATVEMLRITFPYILFIALTGFGGAILNTWNKFSLPAFTSVLLNLAFIGCTLWLAPLMDKPVESLAWAVAIGGVAQLMLQWWGLSKMGLLPRFRLDFGHPGVRRILKQMTPALLGVSVAQISLLLNTVIASNLVTGSITWLSNADRLMEFPTGMLGVALGTILLPSLSKAAKTDEAHFSSLLDWGLRLVLLLALPGALGLALLSAPLVGALYHYGRYTAADVVATQYAVLGYSVGLAGLVLVKVLAPGFYARQDMRTPVRFAVFTLVLTQVLNLALVSLLPRAMGHAGLALAISIGACTNSGLLWHGLIRRGAYQPQPGWWVFLSKLVAALAAMGLCLWLLSPADATWIGLRVQPFLRIGLLGGIVSAGAFVYFATLWVLGFRLRDFKRTG
ncbi:MAG TPA: murein biosynthesis integral membrane protein MurJ [Burkholderiales bacterium]|nr:murein biosynthesis integral membrane protein MurJ [Burkholderiales bacterium]